MEKITGYIHNVSPVKQPYRSMGSCWTIQTQSENLRGVCFSSSKHDEFQKCSEAKSPIKITNFNVKDDNVLMNARVKIERLFDNPFEIKEMPSSQNIAMLSSVSNNQSLSLKAKVVQLTGIKRVPTKNGIKSKAECWLLDPSGTVRLTIWEEFTAQVTEGNTYTFHNLKLLKDTYNHRVYVSTPKEGCSITQCEPFAENLPLPADLPGHFTQTSMVAQVIGIDKFTAYHQCFKCKKRLPDYENSKFVKCACGLCQKIDANKTQYHVQLMLKQVQTQTQTTVTLFTQLLEHALQLLGTQLADPLKEDDVVEAFLSAPKLSVTFDKRSKICVSVELANV